MMSTTAMISRLLLLTVLPPWRPILPRKSYLFGRASLQEPREQQQDQENQKNDYKYRYEPTPHFLTSLAVSRWPAYTAIYTFSDPDETGTVTKKRRPFGDAAHRSSSGELLTSCHPFHRRAWRVPLPRARPRLHPWSQ